MLLYLRKCGAPMKLRNAEGLRLSASDLANAFCRYLEMSSSVDS